MIPEWNWPPEFQNVVIGRQAGALVGCVGVDECDGVVGSGGGRDD